MTHTGLSLWVYLSTTPLLWLTVTLLAWLFIGARSPLAYFDKAVELLLIASLWLDGQRSRRG